MQPRDSVPSSDGSLFYFTALTSGGMPAVFQVPASGGQATLLTSGAPLIAPNSLAISSDDKTLFVTDSGGSGQIYTVPTAGGAATALFGTSGTVPYGIEVRRSGSDQIYFSGKSASSGKPGVFTVSPTGGTVSTVLEGSPLTNPGGVTVASNGDVYVVSIEGSRHSSPARCDSVRRAESRSTWPRPWSWHRDLMRPGTIRSMPSRSPPRMSRR
jgi:Tol biopolymer transport system component